MGKFFKIISTLFLSVLVSACGGEFQLNQVSEQPSEDGNIVTNLAMPLTATASWRRPNSSVYDGKGINFGVNNDQADFNGDGFVDNVICRDGGLATSTGKMVVKIMSGNPAHTGSARVLVQKNVYDEYIGDLRLVFGGCDIAYLKPGEPSIAFTVHRFNVKTKSNRYTAHNKILLNKGDGTFAVRTIKVNDTAYASNGRDVSCVPYPKRLIDNGRGNPGALCFFAGYDAGTLAAGYGTATALLKLERSGTEVIAKDLTPTSGMMWYGGVRGTAANLGNFPCFNWGNGYCGMQGLHVMGGAFFDYNRDGLPDLVPAVKHSGIFSYTMVETYWAPEGIRFAKMDIAPISGYPSESEYMKAVALNDIDSGINMPCVYMSGEYLGSPDHIRCYDSGVWRKVELPRKIASQNFQVAPRFGGNGKIVIKAGGGHYFDTSYRGILLGGSWRTMRSQKVLIRGWACEENSDRHIKIEVFMKKITDSNKVLLGELSNTNVSSNQNIRKRCLQPKATTKNFEIQLNKTDLPGGKRNVYIYATVKATGARKLLRHFKYEKSNGVVRHFTAQ